jgi:hypothetical protein
MYTFTLSLYLKSLAEPEESVRMKPRLVKSVGKVTENKPKIIIRRRGEK